MFFSLLIPLFFSHDEVCDQTEAAQDGFNGSQHVCYLIISSNKCNSLTIESTGIYRYIV